MHPDPAEETEEDEEIEAEASLYRDYEVEITKDTVRSKTAAVSVCDVRAVDVQIRGIADPKQMSWFGSLLLIACLFAGVGFLVFIPLGPNASLYDRAMYWVGIPCLIFWIGTKLERAGSRLIPKKFAHHVALLRTTAGDLELMRCSQGVGRDRIDRAIAAISKAMAAQKTVR